VLVALAILTILPALQMWHWVSINWVPLPYLDEWHTPGSQFESLQRGTLTMAEMFSQHNESRKFFPRLLYLTLAAFGGWDVRKEMRVVFVGICAVCLLLLHLLRRTPGATPLSSMVAWAPMMFLCFAPGQVENFLYGIQLETFFPGFAVLAAAAVNLSRLSFRSKTVVNLALAFVATYTFANGMLLWALVWPLPSPNESSPLRRRRLWSTIYLIAGVISVGCYFIAYHRPSNHPEFASISAQGVDLAHYLILWVGSYFTSDGAGAFVGGFVVLILFTGGGAFALEAIRRRGDWRTFYPWLLIGAYAGATGMITAVGRLGFGLQHALDERYRTFSLFFYLALVGLYFAIYCSRVCSARLATRVIFLTSVCGVGSLIAMCWGASLKKNLAVAASYHESRTNLLRSLEWMESIPDNPDFALILPQVDVLKERALFLEEHRILRLPFVHDPLRSIVRQVPSAAGDAHGRIEVSCLDSNGLLHLKGWGWLPEKNRRADCVVLGCEDRNRVFKPFAVLGTGDARPDLSDPHHNPNLYHSGFTRAVDAANLLPGEVSIKGWAIDLHAQEAWPLASTCRLPAR
jgi:hypothetical protein